MKQIKISFGTVEFLAEIYDNVTGNKILNSLPLKKTVHTWGDEIYFDIPCFVETEPDAKSETKVGELAYWGGGPAFCIFFGPTPVSYGNEPRAISPVNVFGKITGDLKALKNVKNGSIVTVEMA